MLEIGKVNRLKVIKVVDFGYYVGFSEEDKVLLPNRETLGKKLNLSDEVDVFLYRDSEDRLIATCKEPKVKLNQFAYLKVVDMSEFGYFLDWGLDKDLFMPRRAAIGKIELNRYYVVKVELDRESDRLIATAKFRKSLKKDGSNFKVGDRVDSLIYTESDLGYVAIVDNKFEGLIFRNSIGEKLKIGDRRVAHIKRVREDGKIDLTLYSDSDSKEREHRKVVIKKLIENRGFLPFNYKSKPEDIQDFFGLSRKAFKRVLTTLIEEKKIEVSDKGVEKLY